MTKRKNIFSFLAFIAVFGILFSGCKKDDNTGYSTLVPKNVTISVDANFASPVSITEQDSTFTYKVTLSEAQLIDIKLKVSQIAGNADDTDIDYLKTIMIYAGQTSATGWIKTLPADDQIKGDATATLQVGDAEVANASFSPVTFDFNIARDLGDDLTIGMSWANVAPVFDTEGHELGATDIADLILSIEDASGIVIGGSDGGSFEEYTLTGDLDDGVYTVKASFYTPALIDFGDLMDGVELDVMLDFFQSRVQSSSLSFPAIMSTVAPCDFEATLATITKSGSSYTVEAVGTSEFVVDYSKFVGSWGGGDGSYGSGYNWLLPSMITTEDNGTNLDVDGVNFAWMQNIWGETVTASTPFEMTLNSDGTITIADQYYMTTDYDGAAYDYNIVGTGTWNSCSPSSMTIYYDMVQDGFSIGQWLQDNGYSSTNYFMAIIELGSKKSANLMATDKIQKIKR